MAQRALWFWAAAGKDRIDQCTEGTDCVTTRAARLSGDEYLDGTQLTQIHVEVVIAIDAIEARFQKALQLSELQSGNANFANLRDIDRAGAVDSEMEILSILTPSADEQFIARSEHVIGGYRNLLHRRKSVGHIQEEVGPVDRDDAPNRSRDEYLEFSQRLWPVGYERVLSRIRITIEGVCVVTVDGRRCVGRSDSRTWKRPRGDASGSCVHRLTLGWVFSRLTAC